LSDQVTDRDFDAEIRNVIGANIPAGKLLKYRALPDRNTAEVSCFIVMWNDGSQLGTHLCYLREEGGHSGLETGHYFLNCILGSSTVTRANEDFADRVQRGF
jgi:hypothetical protein